MSGFRRKLVQVIVALAPLADLVALAAKIRDPGMRDHVQRIKLVMRMGFPVAEQPQNFLVVGHAGSFGAGDAGGVCVPGRGENAAEGTAAFGASSRSRIC